LSNYTPEVFETRDEAAARWIILTPEAGMSSEQRWELESPWLAERLFFPADGLVLDYGCGIGRLSKLIEHAVLGVDLSSSMRRQAEGYVARESFGVVSPTMFRQMTHGGMRCAGAIAAWVLQHVEDPRATIAEIAAVLDEGAPFYVLNQFRRCVPASGDWSDDGLDVHALLGEYFDLVNDISLPAELFEQGAYFRQYARRIAPKIAGPWWRRKS
jgi:SAM-dependent methyltransferase